MILNIILAGWLPAGALGVFFARKRWYETFGDYEGASWYDWLALTTIFLGYIGLSGSLLFYFSRRGFK